MPVTIGRSVQAASAGSSSLFTGLLHAERACRHGGSYSVDIRSSEIWF